MNMANKVVIVRTVDVLPTPPNERANPLRGGTPPPRQAKGARRLSQLQQNHVADWAEATAKSRHRRDGSASTWSDDSQQRPGWLQKVTAWLKGKLGRKQAPGAL